MYYIYLKEVRSHGIEQTFNAMCLSVKAARVASNKKLLFRTDFQYCLTRSNLFAVLCPGKRAGGTCLLNKRAPSLPTYMACISHNDAFMERVVFQHTLLNIALKKRYCI